MGPKDLRMPGGLKPTALRRLAIDERGTLLALAAIMAVVILALSRGPSSTWGSVTCRRPNYPGQ